MSAKSQIGLEYLFVIGILVAVMIVFIAFSTTQTASADIFEAKTALQRIKDGVMKVYSQGYPSRTYVSIFLPKSYIAENSTISDEVVSIALSSETGEIDVLDSMPACVEGSLPSDYGRYYLIIAAKKSGCISISTQAIYFHPSEIYLEVEKGEEELTNVTISNAGFESVDVNLTVMGEVLGIFDLNASTLEVENETKIENLESGSNFSFTAKAIGSEYGSYSGNVTLKTSALTDKIDVQINVPLLDETPPRIDNIVFTPRILGLNEQVTINATANDSQRGNSDISNCKIKIDNGAWEDMNPADGSYDSPQENVSWNGGPFSWGTHIAYFNCTDSAGNYNDTVSKEFQVNWWNSSWGRRISFNITEPGVADRKNWPVEFSINLSNVQNCTKETRVVNESGADVPFMIFDEVYSGGYCTACNLSIQINISVNEKKKFFIYYNSTNASEVHYSYNRYYNNITFPSGLDSWDTSSGDLANGNNVRASFSLGFPFGYFNNNYTSGYVCSNGFIDWTGSAGTDYSNTQSEFITYHMDAPLWDNLRTDRGSFWCQGTPCGIYRNDYADRTVFTWNVVHASSRWWKARFQTVLYKTGDIMHRYGNFVYEQFFTPTVGISNGDSTNYFNNPWGDEGATIFYQYYKAGQVEIGEEESR